MAGWLHGVFVGDWLFVFPLCGFSLSLFCNYIKLGQSKLFARVCASVQFICGASAWGPIYSCEICKWPNIGEDQTKAGVWYALPGSE